MTFGGLGGTPLTLRQLAHRKNALLSFTEQVAKRRIAAVYGRRLAKQQPHSAVTTRYRHANRDLPGHGQAGHLHQKGIIPGLNHDDALVVRMSGSGGYARDFGDVHFEFHRTMELWWSQFRKGGARDPRITGMRPTIGEYHEAMRRGLKDAGFSRVQTDILHQRAIYEVQELGNTLSTQLLRIPDPVYQRFTDIF